MEAALERLEEDLSSAELQGDVSYLEDRLAPDFLGTNPKGLLLNKEQWISRYASGELKYSSLRREGMAINTPTPDVALLTAKEFSSASYQGDRIRNGEFHVIDVFLRQGDADEWRLAARHMTPVVVSRDADTRKLREVEAKIEQSIEIPVGPDRVWGLVSSSEKRQHSEQTEVIESGEKVSKAGADSPYEKTRQTLVVNPTKEIKFSFISDAIRGEESIVLTPIGETATKVGVSWNIEFSQVPDKPVPDFVQTVIERLISQSTGNMLRRFKEEAESEP